MIINYITVALTRTPRIFLWIGAGYSTFLGREGGKFLKKILQHPRTTKKIMLDKLYVTHHF